MTTKIARLIFALLPLAFLVICETSILTAQRYAAREGESRVRLLHDDLQEAGMSREQTAAIVSYEASAAQLSSSTLVSIAQSLAACLAMGMVPLYSMAAFGRKKEPAADGSGT